MVWANDDLANATVISGASGSITPLAYDSTTDPPTSEAGESVYGAGETLWWKWTAPSSGDIDFATSDSPSDPPDPGGLDTKIQVFSGPSSGPTHASLTFVDSNDDSSAGGESYYYNSRVTISAVAGTTYYIQVDQYSSGQAGTLHLSWATAALPPPPPAITIDFVDAQNHTGLGGSFGGLDDQVLVAGFSVRVELDTGSASNVAQVVLPGGWSTTTFYNVDTSSFWFDLPPVSEGVGSGALVLVDSVGRICSIDISMLTPELAYRAADPVTYDHIPFSGPSQSSYRTGATPSDADAGTINPDGGWGVAFGYSYDGARVGSSIYKLEQLGWQLPLSGYYAISINAIPTLPSTDPPGLTYGQYLIQQEHEAYPFGYTSDFSIDALIGDPVIDIEWQEFTYPAHRWSQFGIAAYVPSAADTPLAGGVPDQTVVQPESFFTTGRRAAHVTPGYNTSVGWGDDLETLANWDLISGAWHAGAGFVGNCMYLDGVGSARQKAATRPGAFEGAHYRMDGWIGGSVAGNSLRVGMEFYDQAGSLISTIWGAPYVVAPGDENLFNDTTWVAGDAPAGSWTRGLIFEFTSGTGQAFFDQVVFRADALGPPNLHMSITLTPADLTTDGAGQAYALLYAVTDAQVALETAVNPTESLRFGLVGATLTAAYQPASWRYWLPAVFKPTPGISAVVIAPLAFDRHYPGPRIGLDDIGFDRHLAGGAQGSTDIGFGRMQRSPDT